MKAGMWMRKEAKILRMAVSPEEKVVAVVQQRRLDSSPLFPSVIIATDKQMVICNRWFMGLKTDITFLPYSHVTSFRMVRGIFFSSVILRIRGSGQEKDFVFGGKEEGVIKGLDEESAIRIINAVGEGVKAQAEIQGMPTPVAFKHAGNFEPSSSRNASGVTNNVGRREQAVKETVEGEKGCHPLINSLR